MRSEPGLRCVRAGPEVHGAELFAAAGLEVAEELSAVGGVTAENQVHQLPAAGGLIAEHVDFRAEIGFGPIAQETDILVRLFSDGGDGLIEVHGLRGGFGGPPSGTQRGATEDSGFDYGNLGRAHDGHVLEQFKDAALLRSGAVVELGRINLGGQVEQDAYFVFKSTDQLVFREDHGYLPFCEQLSLGTTDASLRFACAQLHFVEFAAQPGLRYCEYDECEWIPVRPEGSSFVPGHGGSQNADGKAYDAAH